MIRKMYLSSPMSGLTYSEVMVFRRTLNSALPRHIHVIDPIRSVTTPNEEEYPFHTDPVDFLRTKTAIYKGDKLDVMDCDFLLAYLIGTKEVSIGCTAEIAWADALNKPIILVMEKEGNPHEHPMITEPAGWRVDTILDAVEVVRTRYPERGCW